MNLSLNPSGVCVACASFLACANVSLPVCSHCFTREASGLPTTFFAKAVRSNPARSRAQRKTLGLRLRFISVSAYGLTGSERNGFAPDDGTEERCKQTLFIQRSELRIVL